MDNLERLLRLKNLQPKPTLLTLDERKALHAVGLKEVHQTFLSKWRECHAVGGFELANHVPTKGVRMLLGSVMHKAFERPDECHTMGNKAEWWHELFYECNADQAARDGHKASWIHNGGTLKKGDILDFARDFVNPEILGGITMQGAVLGTLAKIKAFGYEVVGTELRMKYTDGVLYPIDFVGTIDLKLVARRAGLIGIVDAKSYGLWDAYLKRKSPTASRPEAVQITNLPQMRHYHWLHWKTYPREDVDFYALALPTNLVPYKKAGKGYRAGDPKGSPLYQGGALSLSFVKDYEFQMVSWLRLIAAKHFEKLMPGDGHGGTKCPSCGYFNVCMKDSVASRAAALFSGKEFDYMREPTTGENDE